MKKNQKKEKPNAFRFGIVTYGDENDQLTTCRLVGEDGHLSTVDENDHLTAGYDAQMEHKTAVFSVAVISESHAWSTRNTPTFPFPFTSI